jgi:cysteinyl-tRNA synthetase
MSSKHLGLPFDIHGGGMDLRFPHHENEIAQAEAATGKSFANYWMHVGLLTVDGEKMSKSLGNIVNIKDLLKQWNPEVIRFFYAQAQYRSPPDFSLKVLENTAKGLERIHRLQEKLEGISGNTKSSKFDTKTLSKNEKQYLKVVTEFKSQFEQAMDDDFNTPQAVAVLFEFVTKSNKFLEETKKPNPSLCKHALEILLQLGDILTLFQPEKMRKKGEKDEKLVQKLQRLLGNYEKIEGKIEIDELLKAILNVREKARKNKDWNTADDIRDELAALGYEIQDTTEGPVWRKT